MFLQIITRTFNRRPTMLARNQQSLAQLVEDDWHQTLVVDDKGRGVPWANQNLANVVAEGRYLWVLDDDDVCALPTLVSELRAVAEREGYPEVIVMRARHEKFGMLPSDANWRGAPVHGNCGFSNYFIRGDVWEAQRSMFRECECYEADYRFIAQLWYSEMRFAWHDVVVAIYPQQSIGAAE